MTQSTPQLNPKSDYEFVKKMCRVIYPTQSEMDEILRLYRKYIQNIWGYTEGCDCPTGISSLWNELREWVFKNIEKFEH